MIDIYLSGPMTGFKDKNKALFLSNAQKLRDAGYYVLNPWELDCNKPAVTWAESLRRDIKALMQCRTVATLPGWKKSKGASLEVYIAKTLGWQVHSVNYYLRRQLCPTLSKAYAKV